MSAFLLLGGLVVTAVFDTYAAIQTEKNDWSGCQASHRNINRRLVVTCIGIHVHTDKGRRWCGSRFVCRSVDLAFLFIMVATIAIAVMNIFALTRLEEDGHKLTSWAATLACVTFVIACTIILFLV